MQLKYIILFFSPLFYYCYLSTTTTSITYAVDEKKLTDNNPLVADLSFFEKNELGKFRVATNC